MIWYSSSTPIVKSQFVTKIWPSRSTRQASSASRSDVKRWIAGHCNQLFFRLLDNRTAPVTRSPRLASLDEGLDLELMHHLFYGRIQLGLNAGYHLRRVVNYFDIRFDAVTFDQPGAVVFKEGSIRNIEITSVD